MIEASLLLTVLLQQLNMDLKKNLMMGIVLSTLSVLLWINYLPQSVSYIGIFITAWLLINKIRGSQTSFVQLDYILPLTLLAIVQPNWSALFLVVLLNFLPREKESVSPVITVLLLSLSVLSFSFVEQYSAIASVLVVVSSFYAVNNIFKKKISHGLIWGVVIYRNFIYLPDSLSVIVSIYILAPTLLLLTRIWCEDRRANIWQMLHQLCAVALIVAGIQFGEIGFWSLTLCFISFFCIISHEKDESKKLITLPFTATSTLLLIPVSPLMLCMVNGKEGAALAFGLVTSTIVCAGLWRWIGLSEKIFNDIKLNTEKIVAVCIIVAISTLGCIFFFSGSKDGLLAYLTMALILLLAFTVLGLDKKILQNKKRTNLQLLLMENTKPTSASWRWSLRLDVLPNFNQLGGALIIVLDDLTSFIRRSYAVIALTLIASLFILGAINA